MISTGILEIFPNTGLATKFLGNIKNINYEANNIDLYKRDFTNEVHGALGIMSELKLQKDIFTQNIFTPKFLLRYAPGV